MKILIICLLGLLLYQQTMAQDIIKPLYPAGQIPNFKKTNEKEKRDTAEIVRITYVQEPDIAVYLPPKSMATGQAVIICPGGGYSHLSYDWEGTIFAKWLNAKGIAGIVLKYRLPVSKSNINPTLSPLLDAQRAMRIVRAMAPHWHIKKDNIGIMGFSAGGHLAASLATHFDEGNREAMDTIEQQSCRPDFAVLAYPVISMRKPITHNGSRDNLLGPNPDTSLVMAYSNELQVTALTPPTFLVHAMDDKTVPVENSLLFFQALKNKAVSGELHVYPKGGHGFGLANTKGALASWTDRLIDWLRSLKSK
jgi:acetyl esterase/lipase